MIVAFMNSLQLWVLAQALCKIKQVSISSGKVYVWGGAETLPLPGGLLTDAGGGVSEKYTESKVKSTMKHWDLPFYNLLNDILILTI